MAFSSSDGENFFIKLYDGGRYVTHERPGCNIWEIDDWKEFFQTFQAHISNPQPQNP